jgi:hypothetical protein
VIHPLYVIQLNKLIYETYMLDSVDLLELYSEEEHEIEILLFFRSRVAVPIIQPSYVNHN